MNGATTRIAKVALVASALAIGGATATALAEGGADGKPGAGSETGATTAPAPAKAHKLRVVGIVAARDEAARSFTLKVKNRKPAQRRAHASSRGRSHRATRSFTVLAGELAVPPVGRQVLVKGTVEGTTITATLVKVLRGEDNPRRHAHGDDHRGGGGDRGNDGQGRGRSDEAPGRAKGRPAR